MENNIRGESRVEGREQGITEGRQIAIYRYSTENRSLFNAKKGRIYRYSTQFNAFQQNFPVKPFMSSKFKVQCSMFRNSASFCVFCGQERSTLNAQRSTFNTRTSRPRS